MSSQYDSYQIIDIKHQIIKHTIYPSRNLKNTPKSWTNFRFKICCCLSRYTYILLIVYGSIRAAKETGGLCSNSNTALQDPFQGHLQWHFRPLHFRNYVTMPQVACINDGKPFPFFLMKRKLYNQNGSLGQWWWAWGLNKLSNYIIHHNSSTGKNMHFWPVFVEPFALQKQLAEKPITTLLSDCEKAKAEMPWTANKQKIHKPSRTIYPHHKSKLGYNSVNFIFIPTPPNLMAVSPWWPQ